MDVLLLRLDAPLMSFGGVQVDQRGTTRLFPSQSMVTGLLGNALGYDHGDAPALQRLQQRLRYAVREDRPGTVTTEFQTVDLGQDFMRKSWTTRGVPQGRGGGSAKTGTHIRYRQHIAGAAYTLAVTLRGPTTRSPNLDDLEGALRSPRRPLFIGRKHCLPAEPILIARGSYATLGAALTDVPLPTLPGERAPSKANMWCDADDAPNQSGEVLPVSDHRDWANQIHTGRRYIWHGSIDVKAEPHAGRGAPDA